MQLSLVIPVYNESGVIGPTLARATQFLAGRTPEYEVICVDDGSADDSAAEIRTAAADNDRILLRQLPENRGKGAAVREGCLAARGEFVFFLDADLSTPLEEIERFLPILRNGTDMVLGNRRGARSRIVRHQPIHREWLGHAFTSLTRLLLAPEIKDFTCGFKGFRRAAAEQVFRRSTLDGWAFDAELVAIARCRGLRIEQLSVTWTNCPQTKVRLARAISSSLLDLLRLFGRRLRGTYRGEL